MAKQVIIEEFAKELGVPTPLFDIASAHYDQAAERGWVDHDAAVIMKLLEEKAGIPRD